MWRREALHLLEWFGPARTFIDGLVHPDVRTDRLSHARHAAFISSHLAAGLLALALFPPYLALRGTLTLPEAAVFAALASPVLIAFFLSRTGRFEVANILSAVALCAVSALVSLKTGGIGSFAVAWLFVAPIEATISGSRRVVCVAVGISVAAISIIGGLSGMGMIPPPTGLAASPLLHAAGTIAAAAYAGGLSLMGYGLQNFGAALTRSGEARYAMLAENMNDLVTRHGRNGQVVYASPAARAIVGVEPETLLGQGLFERVHIADRPAYLTALSRAVNETQAVTIEFKLRREASGQFVHAWVEMRCRPVLDEQAPQVVCVLRDISERKAHEIAIEAARVEAERANLAKSGFLATMSHELRTPLNAVIGFSEMLMNEKGMRVDAERRAEYAGLIRDSGLHLLSVVNGVLDMSKIETGNFELAAERFALDELLSSCRNMMLLKAEGAGITLDFDMPDQRLNIVADKRACRQICLNLLSNALKFTARGGRVVLSARIEAGALAIRVSDNGIGIAGEHLPRLGEAFYQAASAYDRPYEGTGLGLSVVKGLAELHGGGVEVESSLGVGTVVTVRLPLDCENQASRDALTAAANIAVLPARGSAGAIEDRLGKKRA